MQQTALKIPPVVPEDIPYLYQHLERVAGPPTVARVTLRSDATFSKRFGQKVKALGGRYTYCRGSCTVRNVYVPLLDLPRAVALIQRMVRGAPHPQPLIAFISPVLATPSWAVPCEVNPYAPDPLSDALLLYKTRLERGVRNGKLSRQPIPSAQQLAAKAHKDRVAKVVRGLKDEGYSTAYGTTPAGGNVCLSLDEMERLLAAAKRYQNL